MLDSAILSTVVIMGAMGAMSFGMFAMYAINCHGKDSDIADDAMQNTFSILLCLRCIRQDFEIKI